MIIWLHTSPKKDSHQPVGWRTHAIPVKGPETLIGSLQNTPALCGLVPAHGWCLDLFIEEKCKRCEQQRKSYYANEEEL
jgi:hypothetical protein